MKTKELILFLDREESGEYSTHIKRVPITMKNYFLDVLNGNFFYMAFISQFNDKCYAVVDADSEENLCLATMWLEENSLQYAVIRTSPHHYWIFVDKKFPTMKEAINFCNLIPGQDDKFLQFMKEQKTIYLRGLPYSFRNEDKNKPELVSDLVKKSDLSDFLGAIQEHFDHKLFKWVYRYWEYKTNKVDISSPKTGRNSIGVTLDEIKAEFGL